MSLSALSRGPLMGKAWNIKAIFFVKFIRISRVNLVSSNLLRLHVVTSIPQLSKLNMLLQAVRIRVLCFSFIVSRNI
jgi:hypothetical protein